ncbi:hypothetical protein BpHYR1_048577 [Brachionus plicatilis]|uniref:Uncharacterized protein n=1 Tax=Brachionus plicatilis TaxID=10195 RepID=A0A3M7QYL9_BRAPC|nr:hypothetical protein BpHYR1_048577 [Brachionus plicatilis]
MYNSFKSVNFVGDLEARFKECREIFKKKKEEINANADSSIDQVLNSVKIEKQDRKRTKTSSEFNQKSKKNKIDSSSRDSNAVTSFSNTIIVNENQIIEPISNIISSTEWLNARHIDLALVYIEKAAIMRGYFNLTIANN